MPHSSTDQASGQPLRKAASFSRRGRVAFALAGVLVVAMSGVAEARSKGSVGSRGSRTFDAPPATQTAPSTAQPLQRSQTTPSQVQPRPASPSTQASQPARSRFGGGFFAGLLGAGLLGALFGAGLFGGLGSLTSILGFLMQIALIGGLVYLVVRLLRRRQQPALAGANAGAPMQRSTLGGMVSPGGRAASGGIGAAAAAGTRPASRPSGQEIVIGPDDYAAFERALGDIQTAYGREDIPALWALATPEMAGYFQEELNDNARKGVREAVSDVKLLQGDLAEAWREGPTEYATVAMRYAITEQVIERVSGNAVAGAPEKTEEVTEVWTFRRDSAGPWKLSAIQQVA
ncbi:TIM44-like domain-containing protein [Microvirga calopogonii]|uniref:TIM44-like domain-containing protein n=1 Tax=Microvirga calopogonii TaxID=2078013 RepID=UPI000E0DDB5D|nr:TIM44-like domain-containing protein [Microvirga calopogonii]